MSRGYNPFDDDDDLKNPFATDAPSGSDYDLKKIGVRSNNDASIAIPLGSMNDEKKRMELAEWEEKLKKKEMEIKRREDILTQKTDVVIKKKNWPPVFPITDDTAKDVPVHTQKLQHVAFASWLGIVLCLSWNVIAVLVCWTKGGSAKIFFLAVIFALLGCPLSYVIWYRPLYHAMRTDNVLSFGWFFISYLVHIGFCIIAAIAPPIGFEGKSLTGFLAAVETLSESRLVGILYFIGFSLFCLEIFVSLFVLQKVYMHFRGHK